MPRLRGWRQAANALVMVRPREEGCNMSFRNVGVLLITTPIFVSWKPQNILPQLRDLQNSSQWSFHFKCSSLEWTCVSVWQYTLINAGMHTVYILIFPRARILHIVCQRFTELHTECSSKDSSSLKTFF